MLQPRKEKSMTPSCKLLIFLNRWILMKDHKFVMLSVKNISKEDVRLLLKEKLAICFISSIKEHVLQQRQQYKAEVTKRLKISKKASFSSQMKGVLALLSVLPQTLVPFLELNVILLADCWVRLIIS